MSGKTSKIFEVFEVIPICIYKVVKFIQLYATFMSQIGIRGNHQSCQSLIIMFQEKDNTLYAEFKFLDFKEAFSFMTQVAILAEKHNHHPNWSNVWNTVEIKLCTHDEGDIVTKKDHDLAKDIEIVFERYEK
jgi:4a-hydroxytetrahydrobiopterin dehydratase